jgi:hypothetical protein
MDLLRHAKKLEAGLTRVVDRATKATKSGALDPLEILHAVVARVVAEEQPVGRGRHVFPFNRIKVLVAAPSPETRARISAVFESVPSLQERITSQLCFAQCDTADLTVNVVFVGSPQPQWIHPQWHLELSRASVTPTPPAVALPAAPQPPIALILTDASGESDSLTFQLPRIELGRCPEVRDERDRLIRTNHVAFADTAEHHSISRRHAHIAFVAGTEYRLYDDGSVHGTNVLRQGRTIAVPLGARGVRLRSDDEILVGQSRIRVRF